MKLIKMLKDKFNNLSKAMKTIVVIALVPVVLFGGIFVYATSTVLIDTIFGTDLSNTVNNEEYQKEQEKLKVEKEKQEKLEEENKAKEEAKLKEEQAKKEQEKKNEDAKDSQKETSNSNTNTKEKEEPKKEDKISYDKLQQLYLDIKSEMSYEEVLAKVGESGLPFSETKFNGSKAIKVAFEEGVTPQKYADSGDNINISFDDDDRDGNYVFGTIEYFNNDKFVNIFEYKDGTYWDFRKGEDRGYYINNYQNTMGDKNEKYIKSSSKEEQLKYVISYVKK